MQFILKKTFIIIGAIVALAYGCSGGSPTPTPTPAASLSGYLSQTHVKGATIIADKIVAETTLGNCLLDTNEVSTTSDDDGNFKLEVPAGYNNYVLFSKGGLIVDAADHSVPARPMMAPAGAKNITPVTTLAALNPDLVTQIGAQYDADIADESGVSGEILQLAKIAEAILDMLSDSDNQVVTDIADKFAALQHVADAIDGVDLSDDDAVNAAAATSVDNILDDEAIVPDSMFTDAGSRQAISDSFSDTIEAITAAIDVTGTVMESDVLAETESATDTGVSGVRAELNTVSAKITAIRFLDSASGVLDQIQTTEFTGTKTLTDTVANQISKIALSVSGTNDYATASSYLGISIPFTVIDASTQRKATIECTNMNVAVAADSTITITTSDETQLEINGTNAAGEQVLVEMDYTDPKRSSNDVASPDGQSIVFDFDALSERIEAELGSDSDLFEIGAIGAYTININAEGVPLASFAGQIVVE